MRYDSVLYQVSHIAHNAKCFSPCVYSHLHGQLYSITKIPTYGSYEYKEEGLAPGLIEKIRPR